GRSPELSAKAAPWAPALGSSSKSPAVSASAAPWTPTKEPASSSSVNGVSTGAAVTASPLLRAAAAPFNPSPEKAKATEEEASVPAGGPAAAKSWAERAAAANKAKP
ncbi:unnamed protein product, partial [Polarella glacialis]